jgi:hypothetical protein
MGQFCTLSPTEIRSGFSAEERAAIDSIYDQILIVFGHATQGLTLTREAAAWTRAIYKPRVDPATWDQHRLQFFDVVRSAGRLAAHLATVRGASVICREDMEAALARVTVTVQAREETKRSAEDRRSAAIG